MEKHRPRYERTTPIQFTRAKSHLFFFLFLLPVSQAQIPIPQNATAKVSTIGTALSTIFSTRIPTTTSTSTFSTAYSTSFQPQVSTFPTSNTVVTSGVINFKGCTSTCANAWKLYLEVTSKKGNLCQDPFLTEADKCETCDPSSIDGLSGKSADAYNEIVTQGVYCHELSRLKNFQIAAEIFGGVFLGFLMTIGVLFFYRRRLRLFKRRRRQKGFENALKMRKASRAELPKEVLTQPAEVNEVREVREQDSMSETAGVQESDIQLQSCMVRNSHGSGSLVTISLTPTSPMQMRKNCVKEHPRFMLQDEIPGPE